MDKIRYRRDMVGAFFVSSFAQLFYFIGKGASPLLLFAELLVVIVTGLTYFELATRTAKEQLLKMETDQAERRSKAIIAAMTKRLEALKHLVSVCEIKKKGPGRDENPMMN